MREDGHETRDDGRTVIWSGNDAVMLQPDTDGAFIVTGRFKGMHPFDVVPSLLSWDSIEVFRDKLTEALEARR